MTIVSLDPSTAGSVEAAAQQYVKVFKTVYQGIRG
jgi:hypothetical protein